jgi:hypothetical protein
VTIPDFEIFTRLRARRVRTRVPPEARTETEGGDGVRIERRRRPRAASARTKQDSRQDAAVETWVIGRIAGPKPDAGT